MNQLFGLQHRKGDGLGKGTLFCVKKVPGSYYLARVSEYVYTLR